MEQPSTSARYSLRPALAADAKMIRWITNLVGNNPLSLNWQRFIVAVDAWGEIIGCGQIKPHGDGSLELASLAVLPKWRGRGVARKIIETLLEQQPGTLYLTCRSELEPLYQKFGFRTLEYPEMPAYFRRISRIVVSFNRLLRRPNLLRVMGRN